MASSSSSSEGTEESSSAEMGESSSSEEEDSLPGTADVSSNDGTSSIPSEGEEDDSSEDVTEESAASSDDDAADETEVGSDDEESEVSASEAASATEVESVESEEPSDTSADLEESSEEAESEADEDITESEVASDSDPASGTEAGSESEEPSGNEVSSSVEDTSDSMNDAEAAVEIEDAGDDSEAQSEEESVTDAGDDSEAQSEAESVTDAGDDSEAQSEAESVTDAGDDSEAQSEAESVTDAGDDSEAQSEEESVTDAGDDSEAQSEAESVTDAGDDSGAQSEAESVTDAGDDSEAQSEEESVTDAGDDSEAQSEEESVTEVESQSEASADAGDVEEASSVDEVTESEIASETEVSVSEVDDEDGDATDDSGAGSEAVLSASGELSHSEAAAASDSEVDSAISESEAASESQEMDSYTEKSMSNEEVSTSEVASDIEADEASSESEVASGTEAPSDSETVGDSEEGTSSEKFESSSASEIASEEAEVSSDVEGESETEVGSDSEAESDVDDSAGTNESDTVSANEEPSGSGSKSSKESDHDGFSVGSAALSVGEPASGANAKLKLDEDSASRSEIKLSEHASVNSKNVAEGDSLSEQGDVSRQTDTSESATVESRLSRDEHEQDDRSVQTGTSESASVQTEVSPLVRKPTIRRVLPTQMPNIDSCSELEPSFDGNDDEFSGEESQTGGSKTDARSKYDLEVADTDSQVSAAAKQINGLENDPNSGPFFDPADKEPSQAFVNKQTKTDTTPLTSKLEGQDRLGEAHQDMLDKIDVASVGEMSALTTDTTAIKRRARYAAEKSSVGHSHGPFEAKGSDSRASLPINTGGDPAAASFAVNGAFLEVTQNNGGPLDDHGENGLFRDQSRIVHSGAEADNPEETATTGAGEQPRLFRKKSGILRFIQRGISSVRPSYRRNGVGEGEAASLTHAVDDATSDSPRGDDVMDLEPIETIDEDDEEEYQERSETSVFVPQRLPAIDFETCSIRDDPSESPSVADSFDGVTESAFQKTTEKDTISQPNPPSSKLTRDYSDGTHNSGKGVKRFGLFPRTKLGREYSTVGDDEQSEGMRYNDHDCPSLHFDNIPEASFDPENQLSASKRSFAPGNQKDFAAFPAEPFPTAFSSTTNTEPFFPAFQEPKSPGSNEADRIDSINWSSDFVAPTRPPQNQEIHKLDTGEKQVQNTDDESGESDLSSGSHLVNDFSSSEDDPSLPESNSEQSAQATDDSASHVESSQSIEDAYSSHDEVDDAPSIDNDSHCSGSQELIAADESQSLEDTTHSLDDESESWEVEDNSASLVESQSSGEASHSAVGSQADLVDEFTTSDPDEGSSGSLEGSVELGADESKALRSADSKMLSITRDSSSSEQPAEQDELSQSEGSSTNENDVLVDFMQMSDLISVSTAQDRELQAIEQMTDQVSEAQELDSTMDNLFVGFTIDEALHTDNELAFSQNEEIQHVGHPDMAQNEAFTDSVSSSSSSSHAIFQKRLPDEDSSNPTAIMEHLNSSEEDGGQENEDPTNDSTSNTGDEKSIVIDFGDDEDTVEQSQLHTANPLSSCVPDEAEIETEQQLQSRSSLLQLPQESFLTRASQDSSNTGQGSKGSKGRVRDAFARLGLSRNSPKKLDNDCSGSHDEDHDPSEVALSPPSSPASPLRNLAEKARQRLSAVKHTIPILPSPVSSTASRTLAESLQQELSASNQVTSVEMKTEEATAYDVEELVENNAVEYFPARTEQAEVNQRNSESSGSIGFDEDGVSVALFHKSADIPDDYTYSKETLDIKGTSGHEAQKQSDQSACWNMNNSADISQNSGGSGLIDEETDKENGRKSWPFHRRGGRRPNKDIGALHMEIDVVENVRPQSNPLEPSRAPPSKLALDSDPCQSESKSTVPQDVNSDRSQGSLWSKTTKEHSDRAPSVTPTDTDGPQDEEFAFQHRSQCGKKDVVEKSASFRNDKLTVPQGDANPNQVAPYSQYETKRRKKRGRRKSRKAFCTTITVVLILVLCGIGCGIIASMLLRKRNASSTSAPSISTKPTTPATTPFPPAVTTVEPTGAPVIGQVQYEMICSKMEDCSRLVDAGSPTARAFDWLINPTHNPGLQSFSDSKAITRFALAAIFYSTNGASWVNQLNWLSAEDECTWFSSTTLFPCDPSGFFISLDIENNNLKGTIPLEIGLLTSLQVLRLRNPSTATPSLIGSIPTSIGLLTSLTTVEISGNSFTGFIPTTVGRLVELKSLNLSSNGLDGDIPYQLDALRKLSHLNLSHNALSGIFPPELLRSAIGIEELILKDNRITTVPDEIANLQKLRTLDVSQNEISRFPIGLTRLDQSLQYLDMSFNDIVGTLPSEIGSMQALGALTLSHNKLNGTVPSSLGNVLNLHEIMDLGHNALTGTIPFHIGQLGRLKKLYFNSNRLSGTIPSELVRLNQINAIRLDSNLLTGQVPILLCDLYSFTNPISYADCDELEGGQDCFTYCCSEEAGCRCRFESSTSADEFLRCLG